MHEQQLQTDKYQALDRSLDEFPEVDDPFYDDRSRPLDSPDSRPRLTRGPLSLAGVRSPQAEERRILLVEPDADVASMLRLSIGARLAGTRAVWCPDPRHAEDLLRRSPFDLIICEPVAHGAGGLALVRALATNPETARVPVIILSTGNKRESGAMAQHANLSGWFTKPVDLPSFLQRIHLVLQRG